MDFNPGSPRIQGSALSSKAVAGYVRFALPLDREERVAALASFTWAVRKDVIVLLYAYPKNAAANLTARQVSHLAKAVKEEFGHEERDV